MATSFRLKKCWAAPLIVKATAQRRMAALPGRQQQKQNAQSTCLSLACVYVALPTAYPSSYLYIYACLCLCPCVCECVIKCRFNYMHKATQNLKKKTNKITTLLPNFAGNSCIHMLHETLYWIPCLADVQQKIILTSFF